MRQKKKYDAFISHASEDKDEVVRDLAAGLSAAGYRIWYDEFSLRVGDSLRKSIDRGLNSSRFGIVILSKAFFRKNWPEYELNGLNFREQTFGEKIVLPIWHRVTAQFVASYSPSLADKVALSTSLSISEMVSSLSEVLGRPRPFSRTIAKAPAKYDNDLCQECGGQFHFAQRDPGNAQWPNSSYGLECMKCGRYDLRE
jgi:TIR domain